MNYKAIVIAVFAVFLVGGLAAIFIAQQETADMPQKGSQTEAPEADPAAQGAKVVGEHVTFTITEADHKRWELNVTKAYYFPDKSGANLETVTGKLFNDAGEVSATFSAPAGVFDQKIKSLVLSGGVQVQSADAESVMMTAPQMVWSPKMENVQADGGVRIVRKGFGESLAQKCSFSMDFTFIALEGNAQTQMDL